MCLYLCIYLSIYYISNLCYLYLSRSTSIYIIFIIYVIYLSILYLTPSVTLSLPVDPLFAAVVAAPDSVACVIIAGRPLPSTAPPDSSVLAEAIAASAALWLRDTLRMWSVIGSILRIGRAPVTQSKKVKAQQIKAVTSGSVVADATDANQKQRSGSGSGSGSG